MILPTRVVFRSYTFQTTINYAQNFGKGPLVICDSLLLKMDHRNSWFAHWTCWCSIVLSFLFRIKHLKTPCLLLNSWGSKHHLFRVCFGSHGDNKAPAQENIVAARHFLAMARRSGGVEDAAPARLGQLVDAPKWAVKMGRTRYFIVVWGNWLQV